jgi:hypothetical protein
LSFFPFWSGPGFFSSANLGTFSGVVFVELRA